MKPPANTARAAVWYLVYSAIVPKQILLVSKEPTGQERRPDAEKSAPAAGKKAFAGKPAHFGKLTHARGLPLYRGARQLRATAKATKPARRRNRSKKHFAGGVGPYALVPPAGLSGCPVAGSCLLCFRLGVFVVFAVVLVARAGGRRRLAVRWAFSSRSAVASFLWRFRAWRRFWARVPVFGSSAWLRGGFSLPVRGSLTWFAFRPCVVRVFALSPRLWLPASAPSAVFSLPAPRVRRRPGLSSSLVGC